MKRLTIKILLTIYILSGCNNSENLELSKSTQETQQNIPSEIGSFDSSNSSLQIEDFRNNIEIYDGISLKEIEITGKTYSARFVKQDFLPFGLYIPDFITEEKFEDGNEFLGPNNSIISLFERYQLDIDILEVREDLTGYQHYIGSNIFDGPDQIKVKYEDFFSYSYKENEVIIRLSYFEEDKETLLPQYIDIVKNIKYVE
ncbi:hypothetical protein [Caldalkalibacillus mannanilyticus]|uniref:hypothetical protein n=1 Tax=Caldalkalibacillus mannanilyticus TaxID=1418 RepID=UPI00046AC11B|nr:hypothetical protein [Caldalkalibacillus mannanilyticus]